MRHVFTDPRADELLRKVMADNGLEGRPEDLPLDAQRSIVAMLVEAGVIKFGHGPNGGST